MLHPPTCNQHSKLHTAAPAAAAAGAVVRQAYIGMFYTKKQQHDNFPCTGCGRPSTTSTAPPAARHFIQRSKAACPRGHDTRQCSRILYALCLFPSAGYPLVHWSLDVAPLALVCQPSGQERQAMCLVCQRASMCSCTWPESPPLLQPGCRACGGRQAACSCPTGSVWAAAA